MRDAAKRNPERSAKGGESRDQLTISNLTAKSQIGVTEEERSTPQTVWIDLTLAIDAAVAARRDRIEDTIDYAALVAEVRDIAQRTPYRLLETLAEHIATVATGRFKVPEIRVKVKKRALAGIDYAAVEIVRTRGARRRTRRFGRRIPALAGR